MSGAGFDTLAKLSAAAKLASVSTVSEAIAAENPTSILSWTDILEIGTKAAFEALLCRGDLSRLTDASGVTVLPYAVRFPWFDDYIGDILLHKESPNSLWHYAVHQAAVMGNVEVVTALMKRGFSVEVLDLSKALPLHYAAQYGHSELVRFFMKYQRIDPAIALNAQRQTPLHLAAMNNREEVVRLLVKEYRMPVGAQDIENKTAEEYAIAGNFHVVAKFLGFRARSTSCPSLKAVTAVLTHSKMPSVDLENSSLYVSPVPLDSTYD